MSGCGSLCILSPVLDKTSQESCWVSVCKHSRQSLMVSIIKAGVGITWLFLRSPSLSNWRGKRKKENKRKKQRQKITYFKFPCHFTTPRLYQAKLMATKNTSKIELCKDTFRSVLIIHKETPSHLKTNLTQPYISIFFVKRSELFTGQLNALQTRKDAQEPTRSSSSSSAFSSDSCSFFLLLFSALATPFPAESGFPPAV